MKWDDILLKLRAKERKNPAKYPEFSFKFWVKLAYFLPLLEAQKITKFSL